MHDEYPSNFITDCHLPEYSVIIKYYSKLIDTLAAKKLSHYFVSHNIILIKEEEEITKPTTSSVRAATLLLSRVINPLKAGCASNFYTFLDITQQHGTDVIRSLSTRIRLEVAEMAGKDYLKCLY